MHIDLITPVGIEYSYRGTEFHVYEYAKFLRENGLDARVLVSDYGTEPALPKIGNYKELEKRYEGVPKIKVRCSRYSLPFNFNLFVYRGLDRDSVIYFPYSIYDYLLNIAAKPKGQKYVVCGFSMHLKNGRMLKGYEAVENTFNRAVRSLLSREDISQNVYYQAVNRDQIKYLVGLGARKKNIFYIPPFIDAMTFKASESNGKRLRVIHIGGVDKKADTVVAVIKRLIATKKIGDYEFYFIGRNEPAALRSYSRMYKNIYSLGPVSDKRKITLLSRMDAIIVPAGEAFPKAMLEGMASGLLVLTSQMNPVAKEVEGMGAKIYVTSGKIKEYTDALNQMINEKRSALRFKQSKLKNRDIVVKNYDRRIVLDKILRMFLKITRD